MKLKKSTRIAIAVLALLPLAMTAALYARLPETIPMHWDLNNNVRYDPKASIWGMAALSPLMAVLFIFMPKIDPRRRNYEKFGGVYQGFIVVMLAFLAVMNGVILSEALHPGRIPISKLVPVLIGLLFIYIGNIMPKIKSNFGMGFRTPWALSDPDVWNRTNRLGGFLFFFGGIAMVTGGLLLPSRWMFALTMALVFAMTLPPYIMGYVWYRKKHQDAPQDS